MAINFVQILEDMQNELGSSGTSFEMKFIRAANRVIDDVKTYCFNDDIEHITSPSSVCDLDPKVYNRIFEDGIRYFMVRSGEFAKKPEPYLESDYIRALANIQYHAIKELDPDVGRPTG